MERILYVAMISMYNIPEISYNVMLVHFYESRHDFQLEDVSDSEGFAVVSECGAEVVNGQPIKQFRVPVGKVKHTGHLSSVKKIRKENRFYRMVQLFHF